MSAFPRAKRLETIAGFGINAGAAAAEGRGLLRPENLDPAPPPRPGAAAGTRAAMEEPVSNSWLPFTGDLGLRAAISERTAERHGRVYDPQTEIVITCGGTEAVLDVLLATV